MMRGAEMGQIVEIGGPTVFPGRGVVDVTAGGGSGAAGEPAGAVPQPQPAAEVGRDGVLLLADGEHHPGFRMREQPAEARRPGRDLPAFSPGIGT